MTKDEYDILGQASVDFGLPVSTNLVQNNTDATGSGYKRRLTWCEDWAAKGAKLQGQVMVKWQGALQSFRSNLNPFANNAAFRDVRQLDRPAMIAALREPETRHKILAAATEGPLVRSNGLPTYLYTCRRLIDLSLSL